VRPAHGEHGRRGQADQAGQADGERGADQLRHRAAGQDAETLDGVQAGLGHAERAGPGVGAQRLHERGSRGEPKTIRTPSADTDHSEARAAPA
jgi:hypothetical protein